MGNKEKNGRHSAVKKSKRHVEREDKLRRANRKREGNVSNGLKEDEVIVNIPIKNEFCAPNSVINDKKEKANKQEATCCNLFDFGCSCMSCFGNEFYPCK